MYSESHEILDPLARAIYSSNPGFKDGAAEPHPITDVQDSLLARSEIGEALEATYIASTQAEHDLGAVDLALATKGLKWLRENLDDDARELRKQVISAKSDIASEERSRSLRADYAQRQASVARDAAEKRRLANEVTAAQTARAAQQAAHQAELEQALDTIQQQNPDDDPKGLLALGRHLEIVVDDSNVAAQEKSGFRPALTHRVGEYLQDPSKLVNDIAMLNILLKPPSSNEPISSVIHRYGHVLLVAIDDMTATCRYEYKDFSPTIINQWLEILTRAELSQQGAQIIKDPSKVDRLTLDQVIDTNDRFRGNVGRTLAAYGGLVIANTLHDIIYNQPEHFVDGMYTLAEQGLDPNQKNTREVTIGLLRYCLQSEPLALDILVTATASQDVKTKQKAVDLRICLFQLDSTCRQLLSAANLTEHAVSYQLNRKELKIIKDIYNRYLKMNSKMMSPQQRAALDERSNQHAQEFLNWVATEEGAANTIYGRFASPDNVAEIITKE